MNLATTLDVIRQLEGGDYQAVRYHNGGTVTVGAYGIVREDWPVWSANAGLPGADWRSPAVQDRVAGEAAANLYARYGDWELVAAAWHGGSDVADEIARIHRTVDESPFPSTVEYVQQFRGAGETVPVRQDSQLGFTPTVSDSNWVMPVAGDNEWSPGGYMYRRTPAQIAAGKSPVHQGIDIFANAGTPVVAPVAGIVVSTGYSSVGGFNVKIRGDDGIEYYMAHMQNDPRVRKGDRIGRGYHIGFVGATGNAQGTKPHLHFTMKSSSSGQYMNPSPYLSGGSTASGAFHAAEEVGEIPQQTGAYMADFFEAMSNSIAGGERTDYRSFAEMSADPDDPLATERDLDQITLREV